ncbi:hypothetical protein T265_10329 [Opisthorchis viverrini]|uniref:Uncharacterized protein n=1 Tax=Opisthorchis viverrini TaxID=6198 RepID=A0A075A1Q1_OPIVI|nr:hypothetical protein T265_10329 [Opisthorchis viverrini]KER21329.1 hypothetical protein T265_10329 [Opisthorchis viverrini]
MIYLNPNCTVFEKYTHFQINLVFMGDSIESLVYDVYSIVSKPNSIIECTKQLRMFLMAYAAGLGLKLGVMNRNCYILDMKSDNNRVEVSDT